MIPLLAATLFVSQDLLAKNGISPRKEIVATSGSAVVPGEGKVTLIGACRLSSPGVKPWDWTGQLLNASNAGLYWRAMDERPERVETSTSPDARNFGLAFLLEGGMVASMPMTTKNIASSYLSPPDKATPGRSTYGVKLASEGNAMDIELEVESKKVVDLFTMGSSSSKNLPGGVKAEIESRVSEAFRATSEKTVTFKVRDYFVLLTIPASWRGAAFQMRIAGGKKGDRPGIGSQSGGFDASILKPEYKGMVAFMLRAPEKPGVKTRFILSAQNSYRVKFSAVPTKITPP